MRGYVGAYRPNTLGAAGHDSAEAARAGARPGRGAPAAAGGRAAEGRAEGGGGRRRCGCSSRWRRAISISRSRMMPHGNDVARRGRRLPRDRRGSRIAKRRALGTRRRRRRRTRSAFIQFYVLTSTLFAMSILPPFNKKSPTGSWPIRSSPRFRCWSSSRAMWRTSCRRASAAAGT